MIFDCVIVNGNSHVWGRALVLYIYEYFYVDVINIYVNPNEYCGKLRAARKKTSRQRMAITIESQST